MAHQHVADLAFVQNVVEGDGDTPRIPEDTIDAFPCQAFQ